MLTQEEIANAIPYPDHFPTPEQMVRGDCCYPDAPRPCPLVSCKYNNYLSVGPSGTIVLTWPGKQPEDVPPRNSCVLDIADRGQTPDFPMGEEEIADIMEVTKQRIQQTVEKARLETARILKRQMA